MNAVPSWTKIDHPLSSLDSIRWLSEEDAHIIEVELSASLARYRYNNAYPSAEAVDAALQRFLAFVGKAEK